MSRQQDLYLQQRADGATMHTAAATTGIGIAEARLIENDLARGLLTLPPPTETAEERGDIRPFESEGTAPSHLQEEKPMARKAANDEVEQIPQPDFERACRILRGDVRPAEDKSASARGDLSAAWNAIEKDCHVNKKAAKDVHRLNQMSEELRDDYLRSFYGMMKQFGIGISRDLVDQMGDGEAPEMPIAESAAVTAGDLAAVAAE